MLKNSESPLMIRVCKDRKSKYLALGVSINPEFWDFNKNKPKPKCPNKELIETLHGYMLSVKQVYNSLIKFKSI